MRTTEALGRYGEDVAARYLARSGMTVVDRNFRCPAGEIDIVALDGSVLAVCEVKTRSSLRYGLPAEAVTEAKAARLRRLAVTWLAAYRRCRCGGDTRGGAGRGCRADRPRGIRIDIVEILARPRRPVLIRHLRGVY